jgi:hypothetical protein
MTNNIGTKLKQKKGIYRNGIHFERYSHKIYVEGMNVYNVKTGQKYTICNDNNSIRKPRSVKLVMNHDGEKLYIHSNNIRPMGEFDKISRNLSRLPRKKKKSTKQHKNYKLSRNMRKEYREQRKEINDKLKKRYDALIKKNVDENNSIRLRVKQLASMQPDENIEKNKKKEFFKQMSHKIDFLLTKLDVIPHHLTHDGSSLDYKSAIKNIESKENIKCLITKSL